MIIYSIVRLFQESESIKIFDGLSDAAKEQSTLTTLYIPFYMGFFLYIVYECYNIYSKLRHEELPEIKADPFFEDLLKEIYDRSPKLYLIILFIFLYILSLGIYVLAWILNHHFGKRFKYF